MDSGDDLMSSLAKALEMRRKGDLLSNLNFDDGLSLFLAIDWKWKMEVLNGLVV